MGNGNAQTNASDVSASESEMKGETGKKQRKQTEFAWREGVQISTECTWAEFQKATYGSNENKAKAYYEFTGRTKDFNARKEYMGPTPGKGTSVGLQVIREMYKKNKKAFKFENDKVKKAFERYMNGNKKEYETNWMPKNFLKQVSYQVTYVDEKKKKNIKKAKPLIEFDMGHKHDAVTVWNTFFRYFGEEKGKELAHKWMKFPEIYELQFYSDNRSAGSALGHTEEGRYKKPEDNIEILSEEQLESIMNKYKFSDDFKAECRNAWKEMSKAG